MSRVLVSIFNHAYACNFWTFYAMLFFMDKISLRNFALLVLSFGMLPTQLSYATDVSVNPEESSAESTEEQSTLNTIYIKSINPGYTISDEKETGEAIELVNPTGSTITLDNYSLKYITKSGTSYDLINFCGR